jgi:YfiH family protein
MVPDWPAPARVRALITTRAGGVSRGAFESLNLGDRVGDDPVAVAENRARVAAHVPRPPLWLRQVHGTRVAHTATDRPGCEADAAIAREPGEVLVVMTADCLPVLLADDGGTAVAIAHAGWRGLAAGVIERSVAALRVQPEHLVAYLGPAIGPSAFEVGNEVREAFVAADAAASAAFAPGVPGKWLADLYALGRLRLARLGITRVFGGQFCTYSEPERFFSYRRDGITGRMASLIWLEAEGPL